MNESEQLLGELKNIRTIMDRSTRFLTLSGLSGILVGIYAIVGALIVHQILFADPNSPVQVSSENLKTAPVFVTGILVLILSLFTIFLLTIKKARKEQKAIWGPGSKLLLVNLAIPLLIGGLFTGIVFIREYFDLIIPTFLIFYGLALVNAAKYTKPEILGLGIIEIILGLIAAALPDFGLYFFAFGFGVIHILYGFIFMRNERKKTTA
jgi:hypothetical protein